MWNFKDRGNYWFDIIFHFNMMSCIQSPNFSEISYLQILFMSCKCSLVFNPRIIQESTTIEETLKELFLWVSANEHLPTSEIFKPLYADNLTVTSWWSGLGDIYSKLLTGITLQWTPVSIL